MIESRHNRRLKDIRRLRRSKGAGALLEGDHLISEALAAGLALEAVLATPDYLAGPGGRRLARLLPRAPLAVAGPLLEEIADADSPRGVVAVARIPREGVSALPVLAGGVYLFAEGLQDPGNLGALARVAEAAGASALALAAGSAHPNHPRSLRASAGSLLRLPVAVAASPGELTAHLAPASPRWVALLPRGGVPWTEADLAGTLILAVGAEGPGLSPQLAAEAEIAVTIPLAAPVESLNATVATALLLFEIRRRRSLV